MKTLVIVAHPDLAHSRANRRLVDAVADLPQFAGRHLDAACPDRRIDTASEQAIVAPFPRLVLHDATNVAGMAMPPRRAAAHRRVRLAVPRPACNMSPAMPADRLRVGGVKRPGNRARFGIGTVQCRVVATAAGTSATMTPCRP